MLELNQGGPESTSGKVDLQGLENKVFSSLEVAISDLQEHCLKMDLPLLLGDALGVLKDLPGSLHLTTELEMFSVVKHGHRHLLGWHLVAATLYDLSSSFILTKMELDPC